MTGIKKVTVTVEISDGTVLTLCGETVGNPGNPDFVLQDLKSIITGITAKYAGITTAMYGTQRIIAEEKPRTSQQYRQRSHLLGEDGTTVLGLDDDEPVHYIRNGSMSFTICGADRMSSPRHLPVTESPGDVTCLACQQAMGRNYG